MFPRVTFVTSRWSDGDGKQVFYNRKGGGSQTDPGVETGESWDQNKQGKICRIPLKSWEPLCHKIYNHFYMFLSAEIWGNPDCIPAAPQVI